MQSILCAGDAVTNGSAAMAAPSFLLPLIRRFLMLFLAIKPHHLSFEIYIEFIDNKAFYCFLVFVFFPGMKSLEIWFTNTSKQAH